MTPAPSRQVWQPAARSVRERPIDALRGTALFGVLLVNLLSDFRIPLSRHILEFHTDVDLPDRVADFLLSGVFEFKAFTLFAFLFGVGAAMQAERAEAQGIPARRFLSRRFLVLLGIGLVHLVLIWNGDILTLYGVCGLLLAPAIGLPPRILAVLGLVLLVLPVPIPFPSEATLRTGALQAAAAYGHGSFPDILRYRQQETAELILPLLEMSLPRTLALMLLGAAAGRRGILRQPQTRRGLLIAVLVACGLVGCATTGWKLQAKAFGTAFRLPWGLEDLSTNVALAVAYAAGLLLWFSRFPGNAFTTRLAAVGQMALTNYMTQSVVLGFLFYGYGFGLMDRLGSAAAAGVAVGLFAIQMFYSPIWLRRYWFGPVEWVWRTATYGRRLPFQRRA